nr:histidine kinase [Kibdelosporangium phytohabitans]
MFVGFWLSGRLGARQRGRIRELEADRAEVVRRERALLARELHDILNHSVTAMVLDATAAAETGTDVRETLDRVARTGRDSLAELRRLLGVLRASSADGGHDPLVVPPGLAQIDALVSATPLDVTVVRHGDPGRLDASIEHAAYRVVQEALTNVVKHAGPVATVVSLAFAADQLTVSVVNERPVTAGNPGSGLGLVGMRERVLLVGGMLQVTPRPDGFEVRAVLPSRSVACSA